MLRLPEPNLVKDQQAYNREMRRTLEQAKIVTEADFPTVLARAVPAGIIALFAGSAAPSGWSIVSDLTPPSGYVYVRKN